VIDLVTNYSMYIVYHPISLLYSLLCIILICMFNLHLLGQRTMCYVFIYINPILIHTFSLLYIVLHPHYCFYFLNCFTSHISI
jgi:hypothetical protein